MCELGRLLNQDARSLSPRARSPRLRPPWRWGRPGQQTLAAAALPSPPRERSASQWTNSGTARWLPPPPPTSSLPPVAAWDPNAPAARSPPAGGRRLGGGLPRKWTAVPCWALGRRGQRWRPERHRRRAKFAERVFLARSPGPAGPGVWDVDKLRGARAGVSMRGWGVRSRAPPEPRRLHPSCQPAV